MIMRHWEQQQQQQQHIGTTFKTNQQIQKMERIWSDANVDFNEAGGSLCVALCKLLLGIYMSILMTITTRSLVGALVYHLDGAHICVHDIATQCARVSLVGHCHGQIGHYSGQFPLVEHIDICGLVLLWVYCNCIHVYRLWSIMFGMTEFVKWAQIKSHVVCQPINLVTKKM